MTHKESKFLTFWRALARQFDAVGLEEPTCGTAHKAFVAAGHMCSPNPVDMFVAVAQWRRDFPEFCAFWDGARYRKD